MAPAKATARSRRTQSYSWSSDPSAVRPVYQWPDDDFQHRTPPKMTTPVSGLRHIPEGDASVDTVVRSASRAFKPAGRKMNYDSDSCLTPRSRRTLRRTITEPWPSVSAPVKKPGLDTIYSPTHEILHPMQSLLLEKSLSVDAAKPSVSYVTVRTGMKGNQLTPTRMTQSVDFDSLKSNSPKKKPNSHKFQSYAFPEPREEEGQPQADDSVAARALVLTENASAAQAPKNIVVIIVEAEKKLTKLVALDWAINVAVQTGDEIVILGVLKHVSTPMGYKVVANTDPLVGVSQGLLQSEVQKITDVFEKNLSDSGRRAECEKKNVKLTLRIAPGARARTVVVRELAALKATYAVFDRRVMRGARYYNKHLSCHAVRMRSNGRSTKTIFTTSTQKTSSSPSTPTWSSSSGSPTSGSSTSGSSTSGSASSSPTYFWRRFTSFKSSRNKSSPTTSSLSPRSSTASSEVASPGVDTSLNLDSFMSEMQDFSISMDQSKGLPRGGRSKLALQSCVVADALAYKQGMDSHRIKHRPISVTIPPICAT